MIQVLSYRGSDTGTIIVYPFFPKDGKDGLNGADGAPGINGLNGINGVDGAPGKDGVNGLDGAPGINGTNGTNGVDGTNGVNGDKGDKGDKGEQGEKGDTGFTGPQGPGLAESFITLTRDYTTANNNNLKALFNDPANGAFAASENKTYFFECQFRLSGMSASSGSFSFGILGTATITVIEYFAFAGKSSSASTTALTTVTSLVSTASSTVLMTNNTNTSGWCRITGKIVVSNSGTIIPAFATSQAAATVVKSGAYFRIVEAGSNTIQSLGSWT